MSVVRLSIENCPEDSLKASTGTAQMSKTTNQANKGAHGEPTFSHLWKGICRLFTRILKLKEEKSWEKIAKRQKKEIKVLQARLAEKTESGKKKFAWIEGQIEQGAKSLQDALTAYAEGSHNKRMGEIRWLVALFLQHEELIGKHHRCTQAYQHLATKYKEEREDNGYFMRQNEELSRAKIELENCLMSERGKFAMYERAWYGSGGGA